MKPDRDTLGLVQRSDLWTPSEAGLAPRLLAGRMLLGLGATGSPAAVTGLYTWWHGPSQAKTDGTDETVGLTWFDACV